MSQWWKNKHKAAWEREDSDFLSSDDKKNSFVSSENMLEAKKAAVEQARKALVEEALKQANGNKTKASELLGITRQTIYRLIEKYSLSDNK